MLSLLAVFAAAGVSSWVLTGLVRRRMVARGRLDVPNERSSHVVPTPRGGGLAIAAVVLVGLTGGAALGWLPVNVAVALVGGGILVGTIGWLDDCYSLRALPRLLVHVAAALWTLAWLGGFPRLDVGAGSVALGVAGWVLAALGIVWTVNFYNFMDGIDGIAGGEAVVVGVGGGLLLLGSGTPDLAGISFLIAAASFGFLLWNWSPARVFMGDVGSGVLGYLFSALAVASENRGAVPVLVWVLLLGVFVVDATVTLVRRARDGEAVFNAHRKHAYQRAVQAGWSHARVSAVVVALGVGLGGLGWLAMRLPAFLVGISLGGLGGLVLLHAGVIAWATAPREVPEEQPAAPRRVPDAARAPFRAPSTALSLKRGRRADGAV
ncbi:glycosyltransferase family 4 protein [Longimicrobium sp.]|uniref:MraY family glycosyltransferase n=1 Tax=Longimicrobium sp. TaxID=2029185 RepID=UPI002E300E32|nr:glycosyltransferase family 4 protein [Longimicrobium sp.]HEX6041948.1 glycosyltransferase family 4 protein [Longimicrobium sp.]